MNSTDTYSERKAKQDEQIKDRARIIREACEDSGYIKLTAAVLMLCEGNPTAAMILTLLLNWSGKSAIAGGWIAKSYQAISDELYIKSISGIRTCEKLLVRLGLIKTKVAFWSGSPTTLWRIHMDEVEARLHSPEFEALAIFEGKANASLVNQLFGDQPTKLSDQSLVDDLSLLSQLPEGEAKEMLISFLTRTSELPKRERLTCKNAGEYFRSAEEWAVAGYSSDLVNQTVDELVAKGFSINTPNSLKKAIQHTKLPNRSNPTDNNLVQQKQEQQFDLSNLPENERAIADLLVKSGCKVDLSIIQTWLIKQVTSEDVQHAINWYTDQHGAPSTEKLIKAAPKQAFLRKQYASQSVGRKVFSLNLDMKPLPLRKDSEIRYFTENGKAASPVYENNSDNNAEPSCTTADLSGVTETGDVDQMDSNNDWEEEIDPAEVGFFGYQFDNPLDGKTVTVTLVDTKVRTTEIRIILITAMNYGKNLMFVKANGQEIFLSSEGQQYRRTSVFGIDDLGTPHEIAPTIAALLRH